MSEYGGDLSSMEHRKGNTKRIAYSRIKLRSLKKGTRGDIRLTHADQRPPTNFPRFFRFLIRSRSSFFLFLGSTQKPTYKEWAWKRGINRNTISRVSIIRITFGQWIHVYCENDFERSFFPKNFLVSSAARWIWNSSTRVREPLGQATTQVSEYLDEQLERDWRR